MGAKAGSVKLCRLNHTHRHGLTTYCYHNGGCRCAPCVAINSHHNKRRRRLMAYGTFDGSRVPALGCQRRIQGLQFLGFTFDQIGTAAGVERNTVWRVLKSDTIEPKTRDRVISAYRILMKDPTQGTSERTAATARAKGYVSPLSWNDIDLDAKPVRTVRNPVLRGEKLYAEVEHLREAGESAHQIAKALGKTADALSQAAFARGKYEIASFFRQAVRHERATEYGAEHRERGAA